MSQWQLSASRDAERRLPALRLGWSAVRESEPPTVIITGLGSKGRRRRRRRRKEDAAAVVVEVYAKLAQ